MNEWFYKIALIKIIALSQFFRFVAWHKVFFCYIHKIWSVCLYRFCTRILWRIDTQRAKVCRKMNDILKRFWSKKLVSFILLPILWKMFYTFINVEHCSSIECVKYISKYTHSDSGLAVLAMKIRWKQNGWNLTILQYHVYHQIWSCLKFFKYSNPWLLSLCLSP